MACWKEDGFNRFPKIPFEILWGVASRSSMEELWKYVKHLEEPQLSHIVISGVLESWVGEAVELAGDAAYEAVVKSYMSDAFQMGLFAMEARQRIVNGEDREKVLRELGRKILPQTRGGGTRLTKDQEATLKQIHWELQECVKEVRRRLNIPLVKSDDPFAWSNDWSEDIKADFPDIFDIFSDNELPLITETQSISKTSLNIITSRLATNLPFPIKPRTLRDILNKVQPVRH